MTRPLTRTAISELVPSRSTIPHSLSSALKMRRGLRTERVVKAPYLARAPPKLEARGGKVVARAQCPTRGRRQPTLNRRLNSHRLRFAILRMSEVQFQLADGEQVAHSKRLQIRYSQARDWSQPERWDCIPTQTGQNEIERQKEQE